MYLTFLLIFENGPILIPKLFLNQGCGVVSDLLVEIAICNFDLVHLDSVFAATLTQKYSLSLTSLTDLILITQIPPDTSH